MTWQDVIYLVVMVGIIVAVTGVGANALLLKRCAKCGARNLIDTARCRSCGERLDDEAVGPPSAHG